MTKRFFFKQHPFQGSLRSQISLSDSYRAVLMLRHQRYHFQRACVVVKNPHIDMPFTPTQTHVPYHISRQSQHSVALIVPAFAQAFKKYIPAGRFHPVQHHRHRRRRRIRRHSRMRHRLRRRGRLRSDRVHALQSSLRGQVVQR